MGYSNDSPNPLLAWSEVQDSAGAKLSAYKLDIHLTATNFTGIGYTLATEFLYFVFMFIVTAASTLLNLVADPSVWTDPLNGFYDDTVGKVFTVVPPVYVAAGFAGAGVLMMLFQKTSSVSGKLTSSDFNRIGAIFVLLTLIGIILANPLKLITTMTGAMSDASSSLSSAASGNSGASPISLLADSVVRSTSLQINYGTDMTDACANAWSQSQAAGDLSTFEDAQCYPANSNDPTAVMVLLALVAILYLALPYLVFAVIAAWKFIMHLTAAIVMMFSIVYQSAIGMIRRRPYDGIGGSLAAMAGNLIMAVIIMTLTLGFPTLGYVISTGFDIPTVVQPWVVGLVTLVGAIVIWIVSSRKGRLVKALKADIGGTFDRAFNLTDAKTFSNISDRTDDIRARVAEKATFGLTRRRYMEDTPDEPAQSTAQGAAVNTSLEKPVKSSKGVKAVATPLGDKVKEPKGKFARKALAAAEAAQSLSRLFGKDKTPPTQQPQGKPESLGEFVALSALSRMQNRRASQPATIQKVAAQDLAERARRDDEELSEKERSQAQRHAHENRLARNEIANQQSVLANQQVAAEPPPPVLTTQAPVRGPGGSVQPAIAVENAAISQLVQRAEEVAKNTKQPEAHESVRDRITRDSHLLTGEAKVAPKRETEMENIAMPVNGGFTPAQSEIAKVHSWVTPPAPSAPRMGRYSFHAPQPRTTEAAERETLVKREQRMSRAAGKPANFRLPEGDPTFRVNFTRIGPMRAGGAFESAGLRGRGAEIKSLTSVGSQTNVSRPSSPGPRAKLGARK